MNSDEYLKKRLQEQIDWYDAKSLASQKLFKRLRATEIVAAALIPFLSGIAISNPDFRLVGTVVVGILGMAVTIIAGFLSLGQYQEKWTEYRTTCEALVKEKVLFETGVEPYNGEDAFPLLVQRVETQVSKENTNWAQYITKPAKEKDKT
jgi:hypothetical protein